MASTHARKQGIQSLRREKMGLEGRVKWYSGRRVGKSRVDCSRIKKTLIEEGASTRRLEVSRWKTQELSMRRWMGLARQNIELDENRNRKKLFCAACSSPLFSDHTPCSNTVLPVVMSCETDKLRLQPANNFAGCRNPSFSFHCVAEWMLHADLVSVTVVVSVWSADQCLHPGLHQPAGPVRWSRQDLQCKSLCLLRTCCLKNFMEGCVRIYRVLWKLWF